MWFAALPSITCDFASTLYNNKKKLQKAVKKKSPRWSHQFKIIYSIYPHFIRHLMNRALLITAVNYFCLADFKFLIDFKFKIR